MIPRVFLGVLLAALVARYLRPAPPWAAQEGAGSLLVVAALGTLAFGWIRYVSGYRLARAITGLLLLALVCSAVVAMMARRLAVLPEPEPVPNGLVRIADWFADRRPTWELLAPGFTIGTDRRIVIDGTPDADYSYLAIAQPQRLDEGLYVVVEGVLSAGGVVIGLRQADAWVAFTSLLHPGPFRSCVTVPREGSYQLVVAYGVGAHEPTRVELSPLTLWR